MLYALLIELTYKRLDKRGIDKAKLEAQPPEVRSNFKSKSKATREMWKLKNTVKSVDPNAFIVFGDATEVAGLGFDDNEQI